MVMLLAVFWLSLCGWALAAVLALIQLAFAVLSAGARGAALSAGSLLPALRTCVRLGVIFSSVIIFSMIFQTHNVTLDLSVENFSFDLTAKTGSFVEQLVRFAAVWICSAIVFNLVQRLLDTIMPAETPTGENDGAREQRTANNANR